MSNTQGRIISIDFLRGLTIALMILVNNPGNWEAIYPPFEHSHWHGCTPTDLIFPFFLFIVGMSIAFSMGTKKLDPTAHSSLIKKIIKRGFILFLLGLFLMAFPFFKLETLRIMGVLQRIGLVFIFTGIIFLKTNWRMRLNIAVALMVIYWLLMVLVPVPGIGAPNLKWDTNLGAWLDRTILGSKHLWGLSVSKSEGSLAWDPEGLLGTLPSVATGIFGTLTGQLLKSKTRETNVKLIWIFVSGAVLICLGLAWDMAFPINKSLWTSSFVCYAAGIAMMCTAICYWFVDVLEFKKGTEVFIAFGANAITAYLLSEIVGSLMHTIKIGGVALKTIIFESLFVSWILIPELASLAYSIVWLLLFFVPIWIIYKKKIFIKV